MTGIRTGTKRYAGLFLTMALCFHLHLPCSAGAEPLPVFVSILPQKFFVERIGGERVDVTVMVGPGQNPESGGRISAAGGYPFRKDCICPIPGGW